MMNFLTLLALSYNSYPDFPSWAATYNREYTPTERDYRESVYNANVERIREHNLGDSTWSMAVNKFADLTADEFKALYVSGGFTEHAREVNWYSVTPSAALPASVDWRNHGAVTPVKNQGQCGSCWSFSATGAAEGAWFLSNGSLVSLSEQQLVDCSTAQGNQGCNGGLMDDAFQYIITNNGITTESAYPYSATGPNACEAKGKPVAARLHTFTDVEPSSDNALMTAIAQQPVSVAVEADQNSFQFYSSGVMTSACGTALDHGVLAVGYGSSGAQDYYLVKNSWGADWGEEGYIRLGRGPSYNSGDGQCGILLASSYPTV
jgi:cathepsin L